MAPSRSSGPPSGQPPGAEERLAGNTVWLASIRSESDHRTSSVEEWAWQHRQTLERLLGQPIRRTECNDDQLRIVLRCLLQPTAWDALAADLWQVAVDVDKLDITSVRLDSTTTDGDRSPMADGVIHYGHRKDHCPDPSQVTLMAAAAEPSGHQLACDVHPGQAADDPLSRPSLLGCARCCASRGCWM